MKAAGVAVAGAFFILAAAPAQAAMDVATFLTKVAALKKGPMALFSSDIGLLKHEGTVAANQLRTEREARKKVGQPPLSCPPAKGGGMKADEFIAALQAIPPAERGMSLKDGFARAARYPC